MPGPLHAWYSFHDLAALGDRDAVLAGDIAAAELARLRAFLDGDHGRRVAASARFGRTAGGAVTLELSFEATLRVTCQRCLEGFDCPLAETVRWIVGETETPASAAAGDAELLVLDGDRLRPAALLEDELIVSLPMVPRHASIDECGALAQNLRRVLVDQGGEQASGTLEAELGG